MASEHVWPLRKYGRWEPHEPVGAAAAAPPASGSGSDGLGGLFNGISSGFGFGFGGATPTPTPTSTPPPAAARSPAGRWHYVANKEIRLTLIEDGHAQRLVIRAVLPPWRDLEDVTVSETAPRAMVCRRRDRTLAFQWSEDAGGGGGGGAGPHGTAAAAPPRQCYVKFTTHADASQFARLWSKRVPIVAAAAPVPSTSAARPAAAAAAASSAGMVMQAGLGAFSQVGLGTSSQAGLGAFSQVGLGGLSQADGLSPDVHDDPPPPQALASGAAPMARAGPRIGPGPGPGPGLGMGAETRRAEADSAARRPPGSPQPPASHPYDPPLPSAPRQTRHPEPGGWSPSADAVPISDPTTDLGAAAAAAAAAVHDVAARGALAHVTAGAGARHVGPGAWEAPRAAAGPRDAPEAAADGGWSAACAQLRSLPDDRLRELVRDMVRAPHFLELMDRLNTSLGPEVARHAAGD
ncbi:hypothetical protein CXG81DRAFT_19981 [Caulochytrium protostelioides]|uniref:Uncharacterized protein n=1 Tax=Caulochytrium protostelioides TaxID=1555241 RepID=A0A4P9WWM1_9FUNG|nr:hypothetical protein CAUPRSCDRAFT_10541 [Caulochytrium protostelioides]RKP00018.1 hypothetical protein CXG81DRAFT_19981 [Caulochytrium protostelioides]|eukprot:RKP00018.1 hypothetical protein CXG81DRAFT_19981 [Caulochytrium protostelioides]